MMASRTENNARGLPVRAVAAGVIDDVLKGQSLSRLLPDASAVVSEKDRALLSELVYGTCRWYYRLLAFRAQLMNKPLRKRDSDIAALVLLGLYQLLHTRIKPHAVLQETVNATRQLGKPGFARLVNAVLRRCQREEQALTAAVDSNEAARQACPDWLFGEIGTAWPDHVQGICQTWLEYPPMTLRVNRMKTGVEDYRHLLEQQGIASHPVDAAGQALVLEQAAAVESLPGFADGLVSVQDAGAQLAAELLDVGKRMRVLDACAAPGGKTGHILETEPTARVVAMDIDAERLERVRENLQRLQLSAELVVADVSRSLDKQQGQFERILLDVPCSATGVIRRHPDIRLLRRETDIAGLVSVQAAILRNLWPKLKPGGRMLYVTCSVLPSENSRQVEAFLSETEDAREFVPTAPGWGARCQYGQQILPGEQGMDGFYYACLEKTA